MRHIIFMSVLLGPIISLSFAQENVGEMPVSPGIYIETLFPATDAAIHKLTERHNLERIDTIKACIVGRAVNVQEEGTFFPDTLFYILADSIKNPHFQVYDAKGKRIVKKRLKYTSNKIIINKKLPPGYYFYNIVGHTYRSHTHRLSIKESKK